MPTGETKPVHVDKEATPAPVHTGMVVPTADIKPYTGPDPGVITPYKEAADDLLKNTPEPED